MGTFALLATAVTGTVASRPGSSLRFEHPGRVFSKSHSQGCCVQGVVHDEEPRGHLEEYSDETLYITSPPRRYGGRHGMDASAAIIYSTIETMRGDFGVTKLGAVGYCFGGPYVAQLLANGSFVSAGFTAHPSGVELEQWQNVSKPISVAYGA